MPKRPREADTEAVDSAIAAGFSPRAQPRSRGLVLSVLGRKQGLRLIDNHGALTPDGTYYYQITGLAVPDKGFDYSQEPVRRGARMQIKLLDGSPATVRAWDVVGRRWCVTKLGQLFYRDLKDKNWTGAEHKQFVSLRAVLGHLDRGSPCQRLRRPPPPQIPP